MADSLGTVEDRWRVVLVVIEADGSVVLHAEPTRSAVPCPLCGNLSQRQHSSYERRAMARAIAPRWPSWTGRSAQLACPTSRVMRAAGVTTLPSACFEVGVKPKSMHGC